MRLRFHVALAASLATCACTLAPPTAVAAQADPQAVANALLAADRSFALAGAKRPAADSIAAMIDDDAIVYLVPLPDLARGRREVLALLAKAFAGAPSTLSWAPVRAGISADGSHGFTYGFASRAVAGETPRLSKYVAYWVRRRDGWRVAAYKLAERPAGAVITAMRPAALPQRIVAPVTDAHRISAATDAIDRAERAFSDEAQVIGLGPAFRKYGSSDAMNVGGEADFVYGNDAIGEGLGSEKGSPLHWAPSGVRVATSGDLGFTFGFLERNGPTPPGRLARIPWFTIWRRAAPDQPWLYVAE